MRTVKLTLTVLILAVALLSVAVALFWRQLLTPEQKLRYGLTFDAAEDYAARARAQPDNAAILADYMDALVREGNLGRVLHLSEFHGVEHPMLPELKAAVVRSLSAAELGEVYPLHEDPAVQALADWPAGQVFAYLEGYRHALLGDWASAKNFFATIEERRFPPALRPYYRYYLARSYRLAGTAEERNQISDLLLGITQQTPGSVLSARARYNLIAWFLSAEYPGTDGLALAKDQELSLSLAPGGWASQKARNEFGRYYFDRGDLKNAWPMAYQALLEDPDSLAGKAAGLLCVEILEWIVAEHDGSEAPNGDWFLSVEQPSGVFPALARSGAEHGFAERVATVFQSLQGHLVDEGRWEELKVARAACYRALDDSQGMAGLMAEANLRGLSDTSLATIYFENALLLEEERQWNEALNYYRSSARLGGSHAGQAYLNCYALLKQVQDPLNLGAAIDYLRKVVELYPESEAFAKAVEELLPLLIYQGETAAAGRLAELVTERRSPGTASRSERQRTHGQLMEVARYWQAYLAEKAGEADEAAALREKIPYRYWNYYELTSTYPPPATAAPRRGVIARDENAGEYLAGLGLGEAAREFYEERAETGNPVQVYSELTYSASLKPLNVRQFLATERLERGEVVEPALLDRLLAEAYPRPFAAEVQRASVEFAVPTELIYAVMKKESNFDEDSVSWAGAEGLMQLMPDTTRWLIDRYSLDLDVTRRMEPGANIRLGAAYLASLRADLGLNNTRGVLHAYNKGPGTYQKWLRQYPGADPVLLTELVPNEENEGFAKKVVKYYKIYQWLGGRDAGDGE